MKKIGHKMILASAGSGKTYALTNRFVQLLANGAAPERIVALTFTRKAAGEFFDEILKKLARAASEPAYARRLAVETESPGMEPADFLRLLRATIEAMPRLSLGTLDSFFARIVRSFPLELGLSGEFEVLEETAARRERRRVLRRMFTAAGEPDEAQREFVEAFKRATFGVEEKRLARALDTFLDEHAETFLAAPVEGGWGEATRIWPEGCVWLAEAARLKETTATLRSVWPWAEANEKQRGRLEAFFQTLPEWAPGAPLPDPVNYIVKNAFAVWDDLRRGQADFTLERKKLTLHVEACAALVAVVGGIAGAELVRKLEMTRGLFAVLRGYERNYGETVRRTGRLTFADVQRLLLPEAGGWVLTGGAGGEGRLVVDWRLDAAFDHWLLDEFQDTSFGQWSVLRNLIDEAVQDPEGRRSFFYVGDVKQAIFSWREGDPRLFREIFEHYNREGAVVIEEGRLDRSWRSGPAVVAMVNQVFGAGAVAEVAPAAAAAVWAREWRDHESAQPNLGGYAALRYAEDEAGRFAETLKILTECAPWERGLSTAILVQTNRTAVALADYLRREGGLAAVAESDMRVATDNPVTCALLALLRAAAHPGDTLAQEHVRMTPLGAQLEAAGLGSADALVSRVLAEIHEDGFAGTLENWLGKLAGRLTGDPFSEQRGRQLVQAAQNFDENGSREVAEFLEFAERYTVREAAGAAEVRVLTIHKAKGLGFDLVILPDLEGRTLAERRAGLGVKKGENRAVEWVMSLPAKLFCEHDPVLADYLEKSESEAAYEALCGLYVAMTRAKRAMYVVIEPLVNSTSRNIPRLLETALGQNWQEGDPSWWQQPIRVTETPAVRESLSPLSGTKEVERIWSVAVAPSRAKRTTVGAGALFSLRAGQAAAFGSAVHALFATIEWTETAATTDWKEYAINPEARAEAQACLEAPALKKVWAKPQAESVELWRERAFEMVLDGRWITGIFDRVVVTRDAEGKTLSVTVYDFKTDRGGDSKTEETHMAARYAEQVATYCRAAARLTGVGEAKVVGILVFTANRRLLIL